jgi:hypothetical protein
MLLNSSVIVTGNVGSVRVTGAADKSNIGVSSGNLGLFQAGTFTNGILFVGYTPSNWNDLMAGGTFTPGGTIGSFRVTGYNGLTTPSFVNSVIAAANVGNVLLKSVQTQNSTLRFGVLAHTQIGAVNAGAPSLHYKKGQALPAPVDDFEVTII